jgi:hypothetical protein
MSDLFDEIAGDAAARPEVVVSDTSLKRIALLAEKQLKIQDYISLKEEQINEARKALRDLTELDLPQAMDEAGVSEFRLQDGSRVTVKAFYGACIPKDRVGEAHQWLADNGHGDIIKNEVVCKFGKGDGHMAEQAVELLKAAQFDPEQKESVHASTLKAWVKEQVESGNNLPLDLFGAHIGRKTEIKKG